MNVYFFLDESGDHGMTKIDPNFPLLVLCGVLVSEKKYQKLEARINQLKIDLWGTTDVIFHARDIRRKEGDFRIFRDKSTLDYFIDQFNRIVTESSFRIITAVIKKEEYKNRPNPLVGVYNHAFTFLVERCVFCLDEINTVHQPQLKIIAESRGKDVDTELGKYLKSLLLDPRGTGYVPNTRLANYGTSIRFLSKNTNSAGLQLADMMAYPIAQYVLRNTNVNLPYQVLYPKLYSSRQNSVYGYGMKIYPEREFFKPDPWND